MDGSVKRRLTLGFATNLFSKLSGSAIPLIQVPVFLHFWSVPLFGEWLILSAIPTYLSFSNLGFGSVAYNEMNISMAAGDNARALRIFESCWWLIIALGGAVGLVFSIALYLLPIGTLLEFKEITDSDTRLALLFLGYSVILSQLEQLLGSAYTCVGRYPYGAFVKNCLTIGVFAATIIAVSFRSGVRDTALVIALANLCATVYLCVTVRRDIPWISYGWQHASWIEIRRLTRPAIAFMGFPIGNALNLQGSLLAVGYALGPSSVVIFGTARTVSRVALQFIQMINMTVWPELSNAYGTENWPLIRTLHRRSFQMVLILCLLMIPAVLLVGPWFLTNWTSGKVLPHRSLMSLLLLVVVFNTLWSASSTLAIATNKHRTLAYYYVVATALTVVATYWGASVYGLDGAAISLLLSEIIMNSYVLPNSLSMSHDNWPNFLASLVRLPHPLHIRSLIKRLNAWRASRLG